MVSDSPLIGAWSLASFVVDLNDGGTLLPYGPRAGGRILYAPDGTMSAHLWDPDHHVPGALPPGGTARADPAYFSYCGTWRVVGETLRHHVHAATFPDWTGSEQIRFMALDSDRLTLTAEGVVFGGKTGRGVLIWHRLGS